MLEHLALAGRVRIARRQDPQMIECRGRQPAAARRADDKLPAEQERLDLVDQRVGGQIQRVGNRFHPHRTAAEDPGDRLQVLAILRIEAQPVDAQHVQPVAGDRQGNPPVGTAQGIVADPAEAIVGQPRRAAAAEGNFPGGVVVGLDLEFPHIAGHDFGQLLDAVKIEVLAHLKAVAQGGARAGPCGSWPRSA